MDHDSWDNITHTSKYVSRKRDCSIYVKLNLQKYKPRPRPRTMRCIFPYVTISLIFFQALSISCASNFKLQSWGKLMKTNYSIPNKFMITSDLKWFCKKIIFFGAIDRKQYTHLQFVGNRGYNDLRAQRDAYGGVGWSSDTANMATSCSQLAETLLAGLCIVHSNIYEHVGQVAKQVLPIHHQYWYRVYASEAPGEWVAGSPTSPSDDEVSSPEMLPRAG